MSLFAALSSGVSGLSAYSSAMGMISDNITNVNTVGYKATEASFSTLVTESRSASTYSPGGVKALPQNLISQQGLLQSSTSPTDLSIDGNGFFAVSPEPIAGGTAGVSFTRAGSFTPDANGFLKNTAGLYLMGYKLGANGLAPQNMSTANLVPINITSLTGTAKATTKIDPLRGNLQSSQPVSAQQATYNPAAAGTNMASGTVTPDFTRDIPVVDSLGASHNVTIDALKSSVPNQWHVEIMSTDATAVAPLVNGQLATGTLAFNQDGTINLAGTSPALLNAMNANWTAAGAAAPATSSITMNWGTNGMANGFTQFDTPSTLLSSSTDGARFGNVNGVSIAKDGIVTALFDNGLNQKVYQLPIAIFQNPDGLSRGQGNSYNLSDASGSYQFQAGGAGGAGNVAPSTLEASTVDLAKQFTDLITTQRAFSASTKILTTVDSMLQELNTIIR
jgi:flagellar hook protein FlgE